MFKCKYKLAARANERKVCGRATAAQCPPAECSALQPCSIKTADSLSVKGKSRITKQTG